LSVGCAPEVLAPPPPPAPRMPTLDVEPPPEAEGGMSRVVIDTDVPARVERLVATGQFPHRFHTHEVPLPGLLCAETPCVATMPYGDYELHFSALTDRERSSSVLLRVRHATEVVNHTLGTHHTPPGKEIGAMFVATGLITLLVSVALVPMTDSKTHSNVSSETPAIVAAAGAGQLVLGGFVMAAARGTTQDGSTTQWSPPPTRTIGTGLGFRF
jgi:hypothetical protein